MVFEMSDEIIDVFFFHCLISLAFSHFQVMFELKSVEQNSGPNYFDPDTRRKPLVEDDVCNFILPD